MNEQQLADQIVPILTDSIQPVFTNLLSLFGILFLLFFLMYYLILYYDRIKKIIMKYLPFTRKNNLIIVEKFKEITYATIVGTFLIAIIQGGLLTLNFWLLGNSKCFILGSSYYGIIFFAYYRCSCNLDSCGDYPIYLRKY